MPMPNINDPYDLSAELGGARAVTPPAPYDPYDLSAELGAPKLPAPPAPSAIDDPYDLSAELGEVGTIKVHDPWNPLDVGAGGGQHLIPQTPAPAPQGEALRNQLRLKYGLAPKEIPQPLTPEQIPPPVQELYPTPAPPAPEAFPAESFVTPEPIRQPFASESPIPSLVPEAFEREKPLPEFVAPTETGDLALDIAEAEAQADSLEIEELKQAKELGQKYREFRKKYVKEHPISTLGGLGNFFPEDYADLEQYPDARRKWWEYMANEVVAGGREITGPLISWYKDEDPRIKEGKRVLETTRKLTLRGAKDKVKRGVPLRVEEAEALKNDAGFWESVKLVGKYVSNNPGKFGKELAEAVADDAVTFFLTSKGLGALTRATTSIAARSTAAAKKVQNLSKLKTPTYTPSGKEIVAKDILTEVIEESMIEGAGAGKVDYKTVAGAAVPGTLIGAGHATLKKGLRSIKSRTNVGPDKFPIDPKMIDFPGDKPDTGPLTAGPLPPKEAKFPTVQKAKTWLLRKKPPERKGVYSELQLDDTGLLKPDAFEELKAELPQSRGEFLHDLNKDLNELAVDRVIDPSKTFKRGAEKPVSQESGYLTKGEKFKYERVREAEPFLKVQRIFEKDTGKKLTDDKSIVGRIDQVAGNQKIARLFMQKRLAPIFRGGELDGKTFTEIKPKEYTQLNDFVIAARIKYLYMKNEADAAANKAPKFFDALYTKEWATKTYNKYKDDKNITDRAKSIWKYNREMIERLHRAGHLDNEELKNLLKDPVYVPLFRDIPSILNRKRTEMPMAADVFTSADKGIVGFHPFSDKEVRINDFLPSMIKSTEDNFDIITKTRVFNAVIDMRAESPALKKIIKGPGEFDPEHIDVGRNRIRVVRNGKEVVYDVPNELWEAAYDIGHFGKEFRSLPKRLASGFANAFRMGTVALNPGFAFGNFFRDQQDAMFFSGKSPLANSLKALAHFKNKDAVYEAYIKGGGGIGGPETGIVEPGGYADELIYGANFRKYKKLKDTDVWEEGFFTKKEGEKPEYGIDYTGPAHKYDKTGKLVLDETGTKMEEHGRYMTERQWEKFKAGKTLVWQDVKEVLGALNEMSEMMGRLGNFEHALTQGKSLKDAIHISRQSQIDFMQIGKKMREYNEFIPFLNPGIQGLNLLHEKITKQPEKFAKGFLKWGVVPMAGLTAYNSVNPHYEHVSDREKENNWIFMLGTEGKAYAKIPKGHPMKLLLNPFQFALERGLGLSSKPYSEFFTGAIESASPTSLSGMITPLAKVGLELATNWDFYWKQNIYDENAPLGLQARSATSQTLKDISFALEGIPILQNYYSPAMTEKLLSGLIGGSARNLLFMADLMRGQIKGKKASPEYYPIVRRFYNVAEIWKSDIKDRTSESMGKLLKLSRGKVKIGRAWLRPDGTLPPEFMTKINRYKNELGAEYTKEAENLERLTSGARGTGILLEKVRKVRDQLKPKYKEKGRE